MSDERERLLTVRDVVVDYRTGRRTSTRAVDGVSFELHRGEILGVVGESGSGKSTLARVIAGFTPAGSGEIIRPPVLTGRPNPVQMIFQDSAAALNPRLPAWRSVGEAAAHGTIMGRVAKATAVRHLESVGLTVQHAGRRPDQLSGGERQRVAIARSLAAGAAVIVCDEAVASLDVAVRASILNLLLRSRDESGVGLVFISHDMSVVNKMADRILVMHRGAVVESGGTRQVIDTPRHAYTQRLIQAVPALERVPPARLGGRS